jgi:arabinofuranan 3-O-arabinosyltransferase
VTPRAEGRLVEALRTAAGLLVLVAVVAVQAPGRTANDTKLDLTEDPWGLLARALHLWDPEGAFGQLQNQGYGYLFPMGPFHAVLGEVLPAWTVQRLWWLALLVAGYLGGRHLVEALGVRSAPVAHLAGLALALSPRAVSTLGPISSEAAPLLLSPWVLLPLVHASAGRWTPRRAAAASGLAILLMGGVNATATAAACVPAALWLVTRARWWRRGLTWWWVLCGALATAWWLVPLLLLGRYSPPFLDWIEDASAVTRNVELLDVVRGTSHWLGYVVTTGGPWWDAGFGLATDPVLVVATGVVAALGLAGLALRVPHRGFLVLCLVVGVVAVALPHAGPLDSPWSGAARAALDGPLTPLRNVHKLDPLIRLPLVVGLAHLLVRVVAAGRARSPRGVVALTRPAVAVAAVLALVVSASPALGGRLVSSGAWESVPVWWDDTAAWLAQHEERSLLVPASASGHYAWGSPLDEPLQPLADSPWAVRNGVPLTPAGTVRMLDAVEARLALGSDLGPAADVLRRSGVRFLVLRNDLDDARTGGTAPATARAAVRATPGAEPAAAFGPQVRLDGRVLARAVEVYDLGPAAPAVAAEPLATTTAVTGASEALVPLVGSGLLPGAAVMAPDVADGAPPTGLVVTDSLQARERSFGGSAGSDYGPVLTAEEARGGRDRDHLPWTDPGLRTTADLGPLRALTSSRPAGPPGDLLADAPGHRPAAAFDTDPATAWVALVPSPREADQGARPWLALEAEQPLDVEGTRLRLLDDDVTWGSRLGRPTSVVVRTDTGTATTDVEPAPTRSADDLQVPVGDPARDAAAWVDLRTPPGATRTLRVELVGATGGVTGIVTLAVPVLQREGGQVPSTRVVPDLTDHALAAAEGGTSFAFGTARGTPDGCTPAEGVLRCATARLDVAEDADLDRSFPVPADTALRASGTLHARPSAELDALLDRAAGAQVAASSRRSPAAAARPGAVVDGDPRTAWSPAADDGRPALELTLPAPRTIERLQVRARDSWFAGASATVRVTVDGREQFLEPSSSGVVDLRPVTGRTVRVEVLAGLTQERGSRPADLEVTEVLLDGREWPAVASASTSLPCGDGPPLGVDGRLVPTEASWTADDLLTGGDVTWRACTDVDLDAGRSRLVLGRLPGLVPTSAVLTPADAAAVPAGPRREVEVRTWGATERAVDVGAGDAALLTTTENTNPGWVAELDGETIDPVVVDGWRQAFVVPAGDGGTVRLVFAPDGPYRAGLLVGLLLALLLPVLLLLPSRRAPVVVDAARPRGPVGAAAVAAGVLLAGPAGAAVAVLAVVGARVLGRGVPVAAATAVVLAACVRVVDPLPGRADLVDVVTRLLVLLALCLVVATTTRTIRPWARPGGTGAPGAPAAAPPGGTSASPDPA